jgi:hypothetical protein
MFTDADTNLRCRSRTKWGEIPRIKDLAVPSSSTNERNAKSPISVLEEKDGHLEFYICDVSSTGNSRRSPQGLRHHCSEIRVPTVEHPKGFVGMLKSEM